MTRNHLPTVSCAVLLLTVFAPQVRAEEPLHQRIDKLTGISEKVKLADDATFLRRVSLDLTGRIPGADEARAFLEGDKKDRAQLVDKLLASPQYARRMQYAFDVMIMERRPPKNIPGAEWEEFLRTSFAENKPWDQLASEILSADGADKASRPAAMFLLGREMKMEEVTRDLGRIFLGRDLQCAQCHDHPNVTDYLQRHYHGLTAFLNRSYVFKDPKSKQVSIGEKAEGDVKFTSVFTEESGQTPPRILDFPAIEDPPKAEEPYQVKPAKNVRSVPVYSRRLQLARAMTDPANIAFRRNIANRLWAMMMGRGLVEPVDMIHSDNPPTHPELLDALAQELLDHNYDLQHLIREIALSRTYQLSSQTDAAMSPELAAMAEALIKPLSAEQLGWSMMQAMGVTKQVLDNLVAKQAKTDAEKKTDLANDPKWREEKLHEGVKSIVSRFVKTFGTVGVQATGYDASADQALFLLNGSLVSTWIAPSATRLTGQMLKMEPEASIDELYLAVFTRFPTAEEKAPLAALLSTESADRDTNVQQIVWAALMSAEFRFNH